MNVAKTLSTDPRRKPGRREPAATGDRPRTRKAAGGQLDNLALQGALRAGGRDVAPVLSVLEGAFARDLSGIRLQTDERRLNNLLGAEAHHHRGTIALREGTLDGGDPGSMGILAHEMAHALAPRPTAGPRSLLAPGGAAEHGAGEAGERFRAYAASGYAGPPPRLYPAAASMALFDRYESDEHRRTVDEAIVNALIAGDVSEGERAAAFELALGATPQINVPIRLNNGREVTPGDITALTGDFYAIRDPATGGVDVERSYRFLNAYGNRDEMDELLAAFDKERKGKHISSGTLEGITAGRRYGRPSYLELAEGNDPHFSAPSGTPGTGHNMGAYQAFHEAALEAAAKGEGNRARILESMGMHYLTDRHAGGHLVNKEGLMRASGHGVGSLTSNLAVRWIHDYLNKEGMPTGNVSGATWTALGDARWDDPRNAENRFRTSVSVLTSWTELAEVADDPSRLAEVRERRGAHDTVPRFSPLAQEGLERIADFPAWFLYADNAGDFPGAARGKASRFWHTDIVHPAQDTWSDLRSYAGRAMDWRTWYYGLGGM